MCGCVDPGVRPLSRWYVGADCGGFSGLPRLRRPRRRGGLRHDRGQTPPKRGLRHALHVGALGVEEPQESGEPPSHGLGEVVVPGQRLVFQPEAEDPQRPIQLGPASRRSGPRSCRATGRAARSSRICVWPPVCRPPSGSGTRTAPPPDHGPGRAVRGRPPPPSVVVSSGFHERGTRPASSVSRIVASLPSAQCGLRQPSTRTSIRSPSATRCSRQAWNSAGEMLALELGLEPDELRQPLRCDHLAQQVIVRLGVGALADQVSRARRRRWSA